MRTVTRREVLAYRVAVQQLDRPSGAVADTAVLDLGVQDTGPDGGRWALAVRGVAAPAEDELVTAWTLRGAPHLYRRADLPQVVTATAPWSDADAGKRIVDASRPLKAAGTSNLDALAAVAAAMRELVTAPMAKGDVSGRLAQVLPAPYLRDCRPCGVRHIHEMPFRLAALQAGLELVPGTSPPVLQPVAGLAPAARVDPRLDPVRAYLHVYGPATPQQVAGYVDAPVKDVTARWPADVEQVEVGGQARALLVEDAPLLAAQPEPVVRLLGPFDPYLQARDRELLVEDPGRAKELWRMLGRPGAVLVAGEVAGTWRPRAAGRALTLQVQLWGEPTAVTRTRLEEQAERLAAFRGVRLAGVEVA